MIMSVRSCPARPTNGLPCRSSSAPGASPMNISRVSAGPVPKTVWVRVSARYAHLWHAATTVASESSSACRWLAGTGGVSNAGSLKNGPSNELGGAPSGMSDAAHAAGDGFGMVSAGKSHSFENGIAGRWLLACGLAAS